MATYIKPEAIKDASLPIGKVAAMSENERLAFLVSLGLGKIGVVSQVQNWASDNSGYTISDVVRGLIPQHIIDQWEGLVAHNNKYDGELKFTFNEQTGYFECNDLLDITLNDAILIMQYGDLGSYAKLAVEGKRVRVLFSAYLGVQFAETQRSYVGGGEYTERIFCQGILQIPRCFTPKFDGYDMIKLRRCKEILYLNLSTITGYHSFIGYNALTTFFGIKLAASATFRDSQFLSNESILFLIEHEASSSAITVTLHASAYARAMADESILAALEAHTNISLASA